MKFIYLISIIILCSQSHAQIRRSAEYNCLKRIKSTMAPYINLPEYRASFEHKQLNEVDGLNAFYWDVVDGDRTTRHFSTDKGNYKCSFNSNLADRATLNPEVFNALDPENLPGSITDLMVTTGYSLRSLTATQYSFSCSRDTVYRGTNTESQRNTATGMIDHYLSWSTQLYNEDLIARGTTVGGLPNSPNQFMFNIRQSCWNVLDLNGDNFLRKIESRQRNMDRVYANFTGGSAPPSNGVSSNGVDGSALSE